MSNIEKLRSLLEKVSDSYEEFVISILEDCESYKEFNPHLCENLIEYIEKYPDADSSEIIEADCYSIGLPWGDTNGKWYRWDEEITEEEAQRIVDEYYSGKPRR